MRRQDPTVEMSVSITGKGTTVMWFGLTEVNAASRITELLKKRK
jgi:hypothetical protein